MEAVPPVRTSLLGIPLLVMKLSVLVSGDGGQRGGATNSALHSCLIVAGPGNLTSPVELADCLPPDVI